MMTSIVSIAYVARHAISPASTGSGF